MGKGVTEKVPDIPYTGGLKRVFDLIHNVNIPGTVNVGKKYWVKRTFPTPRTWSLELQKLPRDSGFALRVAVNTAQAGSEGRAWYVLSNLAVTAVKYCAPYIILWVENASGSVANLYFTEGEDDFETENLTKNIAQNDAALKEFRKTPILPPSSIANMNADYVKLSRALTSLVTALRAVNTSAGQRVSDKPPTQARKRNSPTTVIALPAPSRDRAPKGKEKLAESAAGDAGTATAGVDADREAQRTGKGKAVEEAVTTAIRPSPTGRSNYSSDDDVEEVALQPAKRRKQTNVKRREQTVTVTSGPNLTTEAMAAVESKFRAECHTENAAAVAQSMKRSRKRPLRHPKAVGDGQEIDVGKCQAELEDFKTRSAPMYIWGQHFTKKVHVDRMQLAPKDMKYRPFHESLVETLLQVFLTQLHPNKQRLTLMPTSKEEPKTYDEVKDQNFYIINGQHSWAAAKRLIDSPQVSKSQKDAYSEWECDFVYTSDKMLLSELSRRTNNTNQFRWDSPEYLLHIQYARDLWLEYDRPDLTNRLVYKV